MSSGWLMNRNQRYLRHSRQHAHFHDPSIYDTEQIQTKSTTHSIDCCQWSELLETSKLANVRIP
jgi:hypothetical protein